MVVICMCMQVHIHGPDLESLQQVVSKSSLPTEIGGDGEYDVESLLTFLNAFERLPVPCKVGPGPS